MQSEYEIKKYFHRQYGWFPDKDYVDYELAVQKLEDEGCTRSDAQGIVDAQKITR